MTLRYYSSTAQDTTLTFNITNVTSTMSVGSTVGWPTQYPFTLALDYNNANEELVDVTNVSGLVVTITRGVDSSTAISHNAAAPIRHVIIARDIREANAHVNSTIGAHGALDVPGYTTTVNTGGTTNLTATSTTLQVFTGSSFGQSVALPDVATLNIGQRFEIVNYSNFSVSVLTFALNNLGSVAPNSKAIFTCASNSGNTSGSWVWYLFTGSKFYTGTATNGNSYAVLQTQPQINQPTFADVTDATKGVIVNTSGNTTATTGTLATQFTTAKTVTIPDATDTLVGRATTDTLTNKDLTSSTNKINWSAFGGKNAIINGGMDIWQRGTSIAISASTAYQYTADRWCSTSTGAVEAITVSRQATGDTTNLPNIQYALRYQRNSGQTGTTGLGLYQPLETTNSIPFAGKSVTLSFYARAGSNFSATSSLLVVSLSSSTGTDQNPSSVWVGSASVIASNATLTTTWQKFTFTGTIATTATQLYPQFTFNPTGTAGANDYFDITGVQLELGSTATTFSRAGGSIGGELALCQRYYWRANSSEGGLYSPICYGWSRSTTSFEGQVTFPVKMRVSPTSIDYSTLAFIYANGTVSAASAITLDLVNPISGSITGTIAAVSGASLDRKSVV